MINKKSALNEADFLFTSPFNGQLGIRYELMSSQQTIRKRQLSRKRIQSLGDFCFVVH